MLGCLITSAWRAYHSIHTKVIWASMPTISPETPEVGAQFAAVHRQDVCKVMHMFDLPATMQGSSYLQL